MFEKDIAKKETAAATDKLCEKIIQMAESNREETIGDGRIEKVQRQLTAWSRAKLMNRKISAERKAILAAKLKGTEGTILYIMWLMSRISNEIYCVLRMRRVYIMLPGDDMMKGTSRQTYECKKM